MEQLNRQKFRTTVIGTSTLERKFQWLGIRLVDKNGWDVRGMGSMWWDSNRQGERGVNEFKRGRFSCGHRWMSLQGMYQHNERTGQNLNLNEKSGSSLDSITKIVGIRG